MKSGEIRSKFINFFKSRGHVEIAASPLVLKSDPTTLFTSSGMQQLIPYLKGKEHPSGKRLVNSQPGIRVQDIEEVGNYRHTTYFEMLGNWSLGDYFKNDQLAWLFEFLTRELRLPKDKLYISVFAGNASISKDEESASIWKKLGISEEKIYFYDVKKNWWSISGAPDEMLEGEIGGPDSEVFYDFGEGLKLHENSQFRNQPCHPNCDCGRFFEICNSVFIQYKKLAKGLVELPQKNVDFGAGLERLAAATQDSPDIFRIDLFKSLIEGLEKETSLLYRNTMEKDTSFQIIADHIRGSCNLIADGVYPDNKLQGYVLRRLIRRAIFHLHLLGGGVSGGALAHIAEGIKKDYPKVNQNWPGVEKVLVEEGARFKDALERGLAKLRKTVNKGTKIDGKFVFDLYQSEGFPVELTLEILGQNG
ncbi:MAG: alanine--tRNA ligase-related protein, partial [Patescibacteria group bacterium]